MKPEPDLEFQRRPAKRLTILMSVHDRVGHSSLQIELLKRARKAGLSGATVFEGDEGFGESGVMHRAHILSDDRPLALVIIDEPDKIDNFVEEVTALVKGIVATVVNVEIIDV
jgi:uncharacterized protein